MSDDTKPSRYEALLAHRGHSLQCDLGGDEDEEMSVYCETCNEQLERAEKPIETGNDTMVAMRGDGVIGVVVPLVEFADTAQALRHAAWIVAMADPLQRTFPKVLKAVMNT